MFSIRKAKIDDIHIYFEWINDISVRKNSFNSDLVSWDDHFKWYNEKVSSPNFLFYIIQNNLGDFVGQVRFEMIDDENYLISVSVSSKFRGLGYGAPILILACDSLFQIKNSIKINAYIKKENSKSKYIFEKAGFKLLKECKYKNFNSYHYQL